ncbi:kinase-like domain-containing protein [Mycena filopes]|nr:kinase-like domain-containing protein [Mycena filopes]
MPAATETSDVAFAAEIERIREEDFKLKDGSNFFEGAKDLAFEANTFHGLYTRPSGEIYVRVHDFPGTLSGDILRLRTSIPWDLISPHSAVRGDEISPIALDMNRFAEYEYVDEDTADLVAPLPLVAFDEEIHFGKLSRSRSEVPNLLKAKGVPSIVQLIGRTGDGRLVFPKLFPLAERRHLITDITAVQRALLQLADALISLHSMEIIHRDLHPRNLLLSPDAETAYLCDLESLYGSNECPEIRDATAHGLPLELVPYSNKSDVYSFGRLMTDFILQNILRTPWQGTPDGNWLPPAPFRGIVLACIAAEPAARPTMHEVRTMLEEIINSAGQPSV